MAQDLQQILTLFLEILDNRLDEKLEENLDEKLEGFTTKDDLSQEIESLAMKVQDQIYLFQIKLYL